MIVTTQATRTRDGDLLRGDVAGIAIVRIDDPDPRGDDADPRGNDRERSREHSQGLSGTVVGLRLP